VARLAVLAVLAVTALAVLAGCGGGSADTAAEPTQPATQTQAATTGPQTEPGTAECTQEELPDQGADHVTELPQGFEYNSFPATSGPHAAQPAIWNLYTSPVPELNLVHNLEHGGVAVQFGKDVHPDDIRAVVAWYLLSPDGMVAAPLPELEDTIALTAWGHLLTCTGFDEQAITAFRDTYRFNGPEKLPPDTMQRGM